MKANRQVNSVDVASISIPEAEDMIEEALTELTFSRDPVIIRALRFLSPPGYQAIVELNSESGRSKRRNASADTWSPGDDEVRIYFERFDGEAGIPRRTERGVLTTAAINGHQAENVVVEHAVNPEELDSRVKQICSALFEAERGGHAFVSLKWFRDTFLPRKPFIWNDSPELRQTILAEAIERGEVTTGKIANPNTAEFPTTTIRSKRDQA